jgi:hypothetical protein
MYFYTARQASVILDLEGRGIHVFGVLIGFDEVTVAVLAFVGFVRAY